MPLRKLAVAIGFNIDSGPLARIDEQIDEFKAKIGQVEGGIGALDAQVSISSADMVQDLGRAEDSMDDLGKSARRASKDVEEGVDKSSDAIKSFGDRAVEQLKRIDDHWKKVTLGAGLLGGTLEKMARTQAETTVQINRMSASLGIQSDQMRRLALETADVGFPVSDVLELMETGRQQGIRSAAQLQEYAEFWGLVGDGAGESATALAEASAGLRAVGITAGRESEALSAMGYVVEHTTNSVSDLLTFLERTGPQLRRMGLGVEDAAAIMGALEHELGMTARLARTEFRKAVNEADGDLSFMLDTLGLSVDTFRRYQSAVADSSGIIERNAGLVADSFTWMQRIQHRVSELTFAYGPLIESLSALTPILIGLGPALKIVGGGIRGITTALPVIASLAAKAGITLNLSFWPVTLTIMGVVAAVLLAQDVLTYLRGEGDSLTGRIVAWIGTYDEWSTATKVLAGILGGALAVGFGLATKAAVGFVAALLANPITWVVGGIIALGGAIYYLVSHWDEATGWIRSIWEAIVGSVGQGITSIVDWFTTLLERTMATLTAWWDGIRDWFSSTFNFGGMLARAIESAVDAIPTPLRGIAEKIMGFFPQSPAKEGPLTNLSQVGPGIADELAQSIKDADVSGLELAVGSMTVPLQPDVADVQMPEYNGTLMLTPHIASDEIDVLAERNVIPASVETPDAESLSYSSPLNLLPEVDWSQFETVVEDTEMLVHPNVVDVDIPTYEGVLNVTPEVDWSRVDLAFMSPSFDVVPDVEPPDRVTTAPDLTDGSDDDTDRRSRFRGTAEPEVRFNLTVNIDARGSTADDAERIGQTTTDKIRDVLEQWVREAYHSTVMQEV